MMAETMTKEEATEFFSELFGGEHHIPNTIKQFGFGWCVNTIGDLATYDGDMLTKLVFLAHDKCIRASVEPSGFNRTKIAIFKRRRDGRLFDRHPTLEAALSEWRKSHEKEEGMESNG